MKLQNSERDASMELEASSSTFSEEVRENVPEGITGSPLLAIFL